MFVYPGRRSSGCRGHEAVSGDTRDGTGPGASAGSMPGRRRRRRAGIDPVLEPLSVEGSPQRLYISYSVRLGYLAALLFWASTDKHASDSAGFTRTPVSADTTSCLSHTATVNHTTQVRTSQIQAQLMGCQTRYFVIKSNRV